MKVCHILVLDHDPARREVLARALRAAGHQPVLVNDSAEAARALDVPGLDLVALDLGGPGIDPGALRRALLPGESPPPDSMELAERRHIMRALEHTGGNKRRAAHLLGIARSTLLAKVRRYGLEGKPD